MKVSEALPKTKSGQSLTMAQRNVYISKLIDYMLQGYHSTSELARLVGLSRKTVDRYRVLADDLIAKSRLDRNAIRVKQVQRTYMLIEKLMNDLEEIKNSKLSLGKRISLNATTYAQIYKFSSHLALITGMNIETQVNVDHQKLVIIRANNHEKINKTNIVTVDSSD